MADLPHWTGVQARGPAGPSGLQGIAGPPGVPGPRGESEGGKLFPAGLAEGGADNRAPLQAAIDAIAARVRPLGTVVLPEAQLWLAAPLVIPAGVGVTFEGVGAGPELVQGGNFHAIVAGANPRGTARIVTQAVTLGATEVKVNSVDGFTVNGWCELRSQKVFLNDNFEGEPVKVLAINAGTLTVSLEGPTMFAYALADTPTLTPLALTDGMAFSNVLISNHAPATKNEADALNLRGLVGLEVENLRTLGIDDTGIAIWDCIDFNVHRPHFREHINDLDNGRRGYGVHIIGLSAYGRIAQGSMIKGRHFMTTGAPAGGVGPRHIKVSGCQGINQTRGPFDTHGGGRYIDYVDCVAIGIRNSAGGFSHRSPDCSFIDCKVYDSQGGFGFAGGTDNHGDRGVIRGCEVHNITLGPALNLDGVDDCLVENFLLDGLLTNGATGIRVENGSQRATLRGLTARNVGNGTGNFLYFMDGDGHTWDDMHIDGANAGFHCDPAATNVGYGKINARNVAARFTSSVPTSVARPADTHGAGVPSFRAPIGTTYRRVDGAAGTTFHVKEATPSGLSGWSAKA